MQSHCWTEVKASRASLRSCAVPACGSDWRSLCWWYHCHISLKKNGLKWLYPYNQMSTFISRCAETWGKHCTYFWRLVLHSGIILLFAVGNTLPAFLDMCIDEAAKKMMAWRPFTRLVQAMKTLHDELAWIPFLISYILFCGSDRHDFNECHHSNPVQK